MNTQLPHNPFTDATFTQTQQAAYARYVQLMNQRQLGITTPDDDFHDDMARCYFRAAGIPDELKENEKFMSWWREE